MEPSDRPRGVFHEVTGAVAVLRRRGLFTQVPVYQRDGALYAGHGKGFVRLYVEGTSIPDLMVEELIIDQAIEGDTMRRLRLVPPAQPVTIQIGRRK